MTTIFKIIGGGQKIRENANAQLSTEYVKIENSEWPEKSKVCGQSNFTGVLWTTDLDTLQAWADEWAGKNMSLIPVGE